MQTSVATKIQDGAFIPAHPLALTKDKKIDEYAQRRLTRYYIKAGVGGIAVGVHTTQFEIHDDLTLYQRVLTLAAEEMNQHAPDDFIRIAGVSGELQAALQEAEIAKSLGYHAILLSNNGLHHVSEEGLLTRAEEVAQVLPIIGFYLQPAVGGRIFSYAYWQKFAEIERMIAIKMAPFDRYLTIEVARAVLHSSRREQIALYTGNDDNIVNDLFTTFTEEVDGVLQSKTIVGGLLGHWSVWTHTAVALFEQIKAARNLEQMDIKWHTIAQQVTDSNAAFFDSRHQFKGSIAGINEVLRRQGLLQGNWCLSEKEVLSVGQAEEIDRVYRLYPQLHDDAFVEQFLQQDNE